jgi:methylenetetrahydrofolate reductase (NADPH)
VPIIPGIKPITNKKHINTLPRLFHVEVPQDLAEELDNARNDQEARKIGVEWCIQQCRELVKSGVPLIHFYTMSNPGPVRAVVSHGLLSIPQKGCPVLYQATEVPCFIRYCSTKD